MVVGGDGKKMEPESNVLLPSIENMQYAITSEVFYMVAGCGAQRKTFVSGFEYLDLDLKKLMYSTPNFSKDLHMIKILDRPEHPASLSGNLLMSPYHHNRNEYEIHKLIPLDQKHKLVLQRKTEEAIPGDKKTERAFGNSKGGANGLEIQALIQAIEHEIEVTVPVQEGRFEYERRARISKEITKLRKENELLKHTNMSDHGDTMSPGARSSSIFALENMLATSLNTLVSMTSQLSESEERDRVFSGRERWNQV